MMRACFLLVVATASAGVGCSNTAPNAVNANAANTSPAATNPANISAAVTNEEEFPLAIVKNADGFEARLARPMAGVSTVTWQKLQREVADPQGELRVVLCFAVWSITDIQAAYDLADAIPKHSSRPAVLLCPYSEDKELQAAFPKHEPQGPSLLWAIIKHGKVLESGYGYKAGPIEARLTQQVAQPD